MSLPPFLELLVSSVNGDPPAPGAPRLRGARMHAVSIASPADVAAGERVELRVDGERLVIPERFVMPGTVAGAFVVVGLWRGDGVEIELGAFVVPPAWEFGDTSDRTAVNWPVRGEPRPSRLGFRLAAINVGAEPRRLVAAVMCRVVETPARGTPTR